MIEIIAKLEVSINKRFDQIAMLVIDAQDMINSIKDDDKKRNMVKNFRQIKAAQKNRILQEVKCIQLLGKLNRKLSKTQIIVCQSMIVNCINQYLNSQYLVHKNGEPNDLIDAFIYYYEKIKANSKVKQMKVIKNCNLVQQLNFMGQNLQYFLSNVQQSMRCLYQSEKNRFFHLIKQQNRSISPEKKNEEEEDQRFDMTGAIKNKKKRQLQLYCFQLSKILNLEHVYIDYYYFNQMEEEKRKKLLESNYLKRNVSINRIMQLYEKDYQLYKHKKNDRKKAQQMEKYQKISLNQDFFNEQIPE